MKGKWKAEHDPENSLVAASFRIWPGYKRNSAHADFPSRDIARQGKKLKSFENKVVKENDYHLLL